VLISKKKRGIRYFLKKVAKMFSAPPKVQTAVGSTVYGQQVVVPPLSCVYTLIRHLEAEKDLICTEGVYRSSGSVVAKNTLCASMMSANFSLVGHPMLAVTDCIKYILRERFTSLRSALLEEDIAEYKGKSEVDRAVFLTGLLNRLSASEYSLTLFLFRHLAK
jgi:hypothetical protein